MATILGANTLSSGFNVANSVRFNDNDSPSMYKTPGSGGDQRTWTFSTWFKRGNLGSSQWILDAYDGSNDEFHIYVSSGNAIGIYTTGGGFGNNLSISTNNLVRDVSAWYHLVVRCDTTQGTASNRLRIYLNGVEATYGTYNNFTENGQGQVSESGTKHWIGRRNAGDYFDGYFAEMVLVDGSSLAPTSFGEFDSDSPKIWKPIDVSGLTFGTNGFYLDFEDSSNLGNDANGGTDFTEANLATTDQTTDTPTNNFATLNPLENYHAGGTFAEGNTYYTSVSSKHDFAISTMAMPAGKWYAEFKIHQDTEYNIVGITDHGYQGSNQELSEDNYSYGFANYDASKSIVRGNGSTTIDNMPLFGNGDIIGVAVDITNSKLYFSKNGTFINSGDPTSGSTGTGAQSIQDLSSGSGTSYGQDVYFFGVGLWNTSAAGNYSANFGNAPFSISSGNSDANGYGNFEYAVPSGYYALCTKNLAEYGG